MAPARFFSISAGRSLVWAISACSSRTGYPPRDYSAKWCIRQVGIRFAPPPGEVLYGNTRQAAEADYRRAGGVGAVGPVPDRGGPAGGPSEDRARAGRG